jgi:hypothetical protein
MELGNHQRGILALLKRKEPAVYDNYLCHIAKADELALAREVVLWWHAFRVERYCPLTSGILKRLDLFEPAVEQVFCTTALSHFIEETGSAFLGAMREHPHPLVAAVTQFEEALLRVKLGDRKEYRIVWDCDPRAVLEALVNDTALEPLAWRGTWITLVAHDLPQMVQVLRVQLGSPGERDRCEEAPDRSRA